MQNLYGNLAGSASTYKKYKMQSMIAKQLGTNDFKVTNDGTVEYKYKGKTYTAKVDSAGNIVQ